MAEPHQPNNDNQPTNEARHSNPVHHPEQENQNSNRSYSAQHPKHIKKVWKFIGENGSKAHFNNLTSFFMLVVTIILAWYTYRLFNQAIIQSNAAITSSKAAITADSLTKVYNDSLFNMQKTASKKSDSAEKEKFKRDTVQFGLQKRVGEAQINSFKEAQKEFEIENRPLIQITDIKFDMPEENKPLNVIFSFANLGKQPAKCMINDFDVIFGFDKKYKNFDDYPTHKWIHQNFDTYLSGANVLHDHWRSFRSANKKDVVAFENDSVTFFLMGKLRFVNTATSKMGIYEYNYMFSYSHAEINVEGIKDTIIYEK